MVKQNQILTVSEIAQKVEYIIVQFLGPVYVEGEVSNFYRSRAGHIYFSLKDENAVLKCTIWRNVSDSIPFKIIDGMRIVVYGDITTFKAQSQYQMNVKKVRASGLGDLYLAFEMLKNKLEAEGLFDTEIKKKLPKYPTSVGVVTSATGAAIQDIIRVSGRRNPSVKIVVFPAKVQGVGSADSIVKGIQTFNAKKNVDLIIIGRGGGSMEDLWAFNEENVVRSIVASDLPIVSAVGHETDFTLSDFAADLRVPTPSSAAEEVIPELEDINYKLEVIQQKITLAFNRKFDFFITRLQSLKRHLSMLNPEKTIMQKIQRIDELEKRMLNSISQLIRSKETQLQHMHEQLYSLSPEGVLKRGYAIVFKTSNNKIIKSISDVQYGEEVLIKISDGSINSEVKSIL